MNVYIIIVVIIIITIIIISSSIIIIGVGSGREGPCVLLLLVLVRLPPKEHSKILGGEVDQRPWKQKEKAKRREVLNKRYLYIHNIDERIWKYMKVPWPMIAMVKRKYVYTQIMGKEICFFPLYRVGSRTPSSLCIKVNRVQFSNGIDVYSLVFGNTTSANPTTAPSQTQGSSF